MKSKFIRELKEKHPGKWIGIKDTQLVSTADSHRDLYKGLKQKGINGAYVFYSPTKEEKEYDFLF